MESKWAVVMQVSPLLVRFPGDTGDVPVGLKSSGLSFTVADMLLLALVGSQWAVVAKLVATRPRLRRSPLRSHVALTGSLPPDRRPHGSLGCCRRPLSELLTMTPGSRLMPRCQAMRLRWPVGS